jgi:hypothetical protein
MPIRLTRLPPLAKRLRYQRLSWLLGWLRSQDQAISIASARTGRLPALLQSFQ